jgi:uncharacterized protein YjbI with pentapeptide repeats
MFKNAWKQLKYAIRNTARFIHDYPWGYLFFSLLFIGLVIVLSLSYKNDRLGFDSKDLWDWLELLIVPLALAGGALWFEWRQGKTEREIAREKRYDATLEAYFDRMTTLLLDKDLRDSGEDDEVRKIARTRTGIVMRRLDGERNAHIIRFLSEAGLISTDSPLVRWQEIDLAGVSLYGADLRLANLERAHLTGADLRWAKLWKAILLRVDLRQADLSGADLQEADLKKADLWKAKLRDARFYKAELRRADLREADLRGAILWDADLGEVDLRDAVYEKRDLEGADLKGAKVWAHEVETLKSAGVDIEVLEVVEESDEG